MGSQGKVYRGRWVRWGPMVEVNGQPLPPRYDLRDYSQIFRKQAPGSMFSWGDVSPGSAQLALALLADYLGDDTKALSLHLVFRTRFLERLPQSGWRLTAAQLRAMVADLEYRVRVKSEVNHLKLSPIATSRQFDRPRTRIFDRYRSTRCARGA